MLKSYRKDIVALATIFGFMGYAVYVCAAPTEKQKEVITATRAIKVDPAKATPAPATKGEVKPAKDAKPSKATKETIKTKEVVVTPDPKKDPNRKKPTLKAKYADKK